MVSKKGLLETTRPGLLHCGTELHRVEGAMVTVSVRHGTVKKVIYEQLRA